MLLNIISLILRLFYIVSVTKPSCTHLGCLNCKPY
uniref:Uncharacterized protein n=1 Tax=Anguilla anguilla TaxID=7936 RepID=A0A0E9PQR2_ANGAN